MRESKTRGIATGGVIAALYIVLTWVSALFGLASGVIQVRISEALCILPCFSLYAIPGLTIGCFFANLLTGGVILDAVFGSLATLIGAIGTRMMKKVPMWSWIPPVVSNALIIPQVLIHCYFVTDAWWFLMLTVGAGELIGCGLLGTALYHTAGRFEKTI